MTENENRLTKRLQEGKALCIAECEKECTEGYYECHKCKPFADVLVKLAEYEDIGTVEDFKALKEKSVAKKPDKDEFDRFTCPDCGWIVSTEEYGGRFLPHCENCGQSIDWSE